MPTRELVAFALGPLVLAAILWLPPWVFQALVAGAVILAAHELAGMARAHQVAFNRWLPLLAVAAVLVSAWRFGWVGLAVAVTGTLTLLPAAQLALPERPRGGLTGAAVACFAALYLGVGGAFLGWLRALPTPEIAGRLTVFFLLCIWFGDSGAYYVGRSFGRHRMAPRVSPKKTWEGLAGGTLATFAAAAAMKLLLVPQLGWSDAMALATILTVTAPVGDLVESLFKRETGVKDSSTLLFDHGGFLDRTDSVLFSAPPVVLFLLARGLIG